MVDKLKSRGKAKGAESEILGPGEVIVPREYINRELGKVRATLEDLRLVKPGETLDPEKLPEEWRSRVRELLLRAAEAEEKADREDRNPNPGQVRSTKEIQAEMEKQGLRPATLDEMFGMNYDADKTDRPALGRGARKLPSHRHK